MDNNQKLNTGRRLSQNRTGQELFKVSDGLLSNIEDFSNSNKQLPQAAKDINILSAYYNKKAGNGNFIDKISRLNKRFYNCSDRYIKSKKNLEKLNDDLYLNLFQQINCYVEEIERLNKRLTSNNNQEFKKTIDQLNKDIADKKEKIRHYENKIREKTTNEEKLMKEIESYKRRIIFYKDKIKIGLLARNRNSLAEETYSRVGYRRKTGKNQTKYLSPTPDKKTKSYTNKPKSNKDLKDEEISIKDNEKIIKKSNSGEKIKKPNKIYKTKESVYRPDNYFANRTEYDIDGKDIEEKDDEYNFNLIKEDKENPINSLNKITDDNMQNTSGLINALTQELYGSPLNNKKDTIESEKLTSEDYKKNISSDFFSDKREKTEIEQDEKSKTLNRNTKGRSTINKKKVKQRYSNVNENIKSKIFDNSKTTSNKKKNNINLKTESENNFSSSNKSKQAKTTTKSRSKNPNKSSEKVSSFPEVHTPYVKKKFKNQFDKEKDKTNINSIDSKKNLKLNTNITPSTKKGLGNATKTETNLIKNKLNSTNENNNFSKTYKRPELNNKKYIGYNSTSNLNVVSGKERFSNISSKYNAPKKLSEKDNKELYNALIDVNDDYLKSIEMLRKQEDIINHLLKDINLDEK